MSDGMEVAAVRYGAQTTGTIEKLIRQQHAESG
jgi:hypothetical protein